MRTTTQEQLKAMAEKHGVPLVIAEKFQRLLEEVERYNKKRNKIKIGVLNDGN